MGNIDVRINLKLYTWFFFISLHASQKQTYSTLRKFLLLQCYNRDNTPYFISYGPTYFA